MPPTDSPAKPDTTAHKTTTSPFFALFGVTRRLSRLRGKDGDRRDWTPWILLFLFAMVVAYYVAPRQKSFFLDLTTDYLRVTTDKDTQIVWELPSAGICLPRHKINVDDYAGFDAPQIKRCDSDVYLELAQTDIELDWPDGITLVMRPGLGRTLDVVIRFADTTAPVHIADVPISSESILVIPVDAFADFGGLAVTGQLVAGQVAENSTLMMLRSGRYETREHYWFRSPVRLVDSGAFSLGDVVSIERYDPGTPLSAYAFLTLTNAQTPFASSKTNLRAIISTDEAYSRLRLDRARARSAFLEPSWSQRLSNDPLAIGFATVLSLFGATLAALGAFLRKKE